VDEDEDEAMLHRLFHYINTSKTFCLEEKPETRLTREDATLKYKANALVIALFALPSFGGSLTLTMKFIPSIFSIFSSLAKGLALINIFIKLFSPSG